MSPHDDLASASLLSAEEEFVRTAFRDLARDVAPGSGTIAAIALRRRARVRRRLAVTAVCAATLVLGAGTALLGNGRSDANTILPADPPTNRQSSSAGPRGPATAPVTVTPVSGIDVDGVQITQLPEGFVRSNITSGESAQGTPEVTSRFVDGEAVGGGSLDGALYAVTVARGPVSLEGVADAGGFATSADFLHGATVEWTEVRGNRAVALIGAVRDPSGGGDFAVYWTEAGVTVGVMGVRAELDAVRAIAAGAVVGPPPSLPTDETTAREEITTMVSQAVDGGVPTAGRLAAVEDDPAIPAAAAQAAEANPTLVETLVASVLDIRFLGPDRAAVTIRLAWGRQGETSVPSYLEAVRRGGDRWLVTSNSYLALLRQAGG